MSYRKKLIEVGVELVERGLADVIPPGREDQQHREPIALGNVGGVEDAERRLAAQEPEETAPIHRANARAQSNSGSGPTIFLITNNTKRPTDPS